MAKAILLSVIVVPAVLGVVASSLRSARRGMRLVVWGTLAFDAIYVLLLVYVFLRIR